MCPVVADKLGGAGTRRPRQEGDGRTSPSTWSTPPSLLPTCAWASSCAHSHAESEPSSARAREARARHGNPIEQQHEIMRRVGTEPRADPARGAAGLHTAPELPGFPTHTFDTIHREHYYQPNHTGMSSCERDMIFQIRTVPGQMLLSVRADEVRLLDEIRRDARAWTPRPHPRERPRGRTVRGSHGGVARRSAGDGLAEGHRLAAARRRWRRPGPPGTLVTATS